MTSTPIVTKLKNNFSVISERVPDVNSVGINIWVAAGSRHETDDKIGLAHFLEHMAFKGTSTRSALDIAKTFDVIGGNFNAYTDKEHTVYHVKVMKNDAQVALEVLADIIINSTFPDEEIGREKDVVLQEIYQTNDSPSSLIFDKYLEAAYGNGQIFGRSILGSEDSVRNFSKSDLVEHMRKHYFSGNMILSLAGDLSHDEVLRMSQAFEQVQDREGAAVTTSTYTGGEYLEERDLEQVNIMLGFPGVDYNDHRYYHMQVLDSILGNGLSSRLFQEVREKLGLVYSISSFNISYSDGGIFSIHAATDSGKLPTLIKTVTTELKKLPHDVTEAELTRTKSKLVSEVLMSRESTVAKSEATGYHYTHHGRYISKEEIIQKINAVSLADVKSAAEFLLSSRSNMTLAAIGKLGPLENGYREKISSMLS
ncbi:M16 family metallopeptidase [Anaplasma bovis]|uniref:M16 family metallopeptidase n=1 Tax=Anaplasma bovis TaxID=186733 RepID=UPI002FEFECA4